MKMIENFMLRQVAKFRSIDL